VNKFRLSQLAPLTGIVSVALLIVGLTTIGMNDYLPSVDRVVAFLNDKAAQMGTWVYLGLLSAFLMVWFAGSVSSASDSGEGDAGRLARIAFGGGLAAGIVLALTFAMTSAAADRASSAGGISPEGATTLYDLRSSLVGAALPISLALFAGAAGAAILRNKVFPAWLGWLGVLAALAALSPVGYLGQVGPMLWIAIASIWLSVRGLSAGAAES
jgi:hypothetical protein